LLRNTNDHPKVLIKHIKRLEELDIRTLSIFIPDPINYSAPYRVSLQRLKKIIDEFKWSSPSWINSTRFVLDTHYGKVRMEDLVSYNNETKVAIFRREDNEVEYHDFPEDLDSPGNLQTMLWKD
jgi:L-lysine 2,3-aminomutase